MSTQNNDIITDAKSFSGALTLDLTDAEISAAYRTITYVKRKHEEIWRRKYPFDSETTIHRLLDEFSDEVKSELAERANILATVDTTPLLNGEPPIIEIIGKIGTGGSSEFDHEKKAYEVKKAVSRNEDFYGQKESIHGSYDIRDRRSR